MNKLFLLSVVSLFFAACSTSQKVTVVPGNENKIVRSTYFVPHKDNSADMDMHIQRELVNHNIPFQTGPDVATKSDVDMIIKYSDSWKWDISMYLNRLNIQFYDAKTGQLMAQGEWENSALHRFPDEDEVVHNLMDELVSEVHLAPKK